MAITVRIGNENDFKPAKLLPGEPAASLDTPKFRIGIGSGKYLELATIQELQDILDASQEEYEAFQSFINYLRENPNAYDAIIAQLDALPGKYVQLTNLTQLTEQNLTLETLNPGNYYALSAVANTFADKPEGVTLAQSYVTVYWDFWTTGNTTKRIELISRGDGRKWYKSYDGTKWGNWIEYTRNVNGSPVDENGVSVDRIAKPIYLGSRETINLNEMMEPGIYYNHNADKLTNSTLLNYPDYSIPASNRAFVLEVYTCSNIRMQVLRNISPAYPYTWERRYQWWEGGTGEGWKEWKKLTYEGHNHNSFTPKDVSGQTLDIQDLAVETPEIEWFRCGTNGGAANISNIPVANLPFFLEKKVVRGYGTGNDFIARFRFLSSNKKEYECWCTVSTTGEKTWTDWQEITFGGYETGTWTPTLAGSDSSGAGAFSYTTREGTYCKLGNLVYLSGEIRGTVQTAPTGYYNILGIPFTCSKFPQSNVIIPYSSGGEEESFRNFRNAGVNGNKLELIDRDGYTAINTKIQCASGNNFAIVFSGWYRTEE